MRIAYISADPGVPVFGRKGCSIHVQEVVRAMLKRELQVDLFATNCDGERPPGLANVRLHPLPRAKGDLALRELLSLAANGDLRTALEREGPFDLVYERYSLWSVAGIEYARSMEIPGLLEVNAPLIEEQAQHRGLVDRATAEQVAAQAFGNATALLAVSDGVATYLERWPAARGKVHVVPNGVDPERFRGSHKTPLSVAADVSRLTPFGKSQSGLTSAATISKGPLTADSNPAPHSAFTVGFVGTLKPWHGLSALVEAFAAFHRQTPNSRLLIVGDGPEREALVADIQACGLTAAVQFTGAVGPEEIPRWLASMSVAVAPYPKLPDFYFSPLKVFEYMAAGLPVVASRIGQLESLIRHGVNGLLVDPGEPAALALALRQVHDDAHLRARLGQAARAQALAEHTWDAVVTRILGLAGREATGQACTLK